MNGIDDYKISEIRQKFPVTIKLTIKCGGGGGGGWGGGGGCKVTLAVVIMPVCLLLFSHEGKPSRKYFCLK